MPDTAVNVGQRRSIAEFGRVARDSVTSQHHARGPQPKPIPKLIVQADQVGLARLYLVRADSEVGGSGLSFHVVQSSANGKYLVLRLTDDIAPHKRRPGEKTATAPDEASRLRRSAAIGPRSRTHADSAGRGAQSFVSETSSAGVRALALRDALRNRS